MRIGLTGAAGNAEGIIRQAERADAAIVGDDASASRARTRALLKALAAG